MTVHFIGAGPGAADLITLRGRDLLARCPVCLYAGSVVPPELLAHCPPGARLVDTAPMSLDEIEAEYRRRRMRPGTTSRGCIPATSRSGARSPSRCGGWRRRGIAYTLTPGVPAFAAAAAALGRELTIPEVAQSLVLTRVSGRASAMPAGETLAAFGRTGATLAIHLAVHALPRVVAELAPLYGARLPGGGGGAGELAGGAGGARRRSGRSRRRWRRRRSTARRSSSSAPGSRRRGSATARSTTPATSAGSAGGRDHEPRRPRWRGWRRSSPAFEPGHVWLAGAGPGRLGCLTLEVVAALAAADAVVYDALVDPAALRAAEGAALHFVGKRRGQPSTEQARSMRCWWSWRGSGARVLRLKGGRPDALRARRRGGAGAGARRACRSGSCRGSARRFGALAGAAIPATQRGVSKALILATGHAVGHGGATRLGGAGADRAADRGLHGAGGARRRSPRR